MTLKDETRISLAPNSEVRLDRFLNATSEGRLAFTLRIVTVGELLLKAGLDASLIDVQSHGESDPLVRTADNTYELRNRRVEVAVR